MVCSTGALSSMFLASSSELASRQSEYAGSERRILSGRARGTCEVALVTVDRVRARGCLEFGLFIQTVTM